MPGKPFVDVADLCLNLMRAAETPSFPGLRRTWAICCLVHEALHTGVVGNANSPDVRPFIIEHGRNAGETARLNGVSLYAPHVAPGRDFSSVKGLYHKFLFAEKTRWSELVHALAESS